MTKAQKEKKLEAIAEEIRRCRTCKKEKIGIAVPGEGSPDADIMFLGEAPGKEEAKSGRPFIGRSGKLLRSLIADAGLKEEDIFITSPVKYLPEHGTPTLPEIVHGRTHLFSQLAVIEPTFVVLLGKTACIAMLGEAVEIGKRHGELLEREGIRYFISYHPAAPLHLPKLRGELLRDFKKLKTILKKV